MADIWFRAVGIGISLGGLISIENAYCVIPEHIRFYKCVVIVSMSSSLLFLFVYMALKLKERLPGPFELRFIVIGIDIIWACLYYSAGIDAFSDDKDCSEFAPKSGRVAASVFGFLSLIAYGILAKLGVNEMRKIRRAEEAEERRPILRMIPMRPVLRMTRIQP